ncbi:hypothetical protein BH11PSE2_BH11PSE2_07540 [soil metagenome]
MLRTGMVKPGLTYAEVSQRAQEIRWYYQSRTGRQQRWIDGNTAGTVLGSAAYLVSTKSSNLTLSYFGGLAVAPLVVAQFNAYEPTRDLFHGSSIGVDLIAARYDRYVRALDLVTAYVPSDAPAALAKNQCASASAQLVLVKKSDIAADDKKIVVGQLEAVEKACGSLNADADKFRNVARAGAALKDQLPYLYARDILALDELVVHRDHDLRFTPFETLTSIAAAPFQTVSTLLTGESGKTATEALKTQATFNNLELELSEILVPVQPTIAATERVMVSTEATGLRDVAARTAAYPNADLIKSAVGAAVDAAGAINDARYGLEFTSLCVTKLREAAAANRLTFDYDATKSGAITVKVSPPSVDTPALVKVGSKDEKK